MLVCIWIFLVVRAWIRACEYAGVHACKLNGECDTSHGQDSCKCDCTCTFLLRNLRGYVYAHRCFIDCSSYSTMQLFQVLELAASLFVPNFLCRCLTVSAHTVRSQSASMIAGAFGLPKFLGPMHPCLCSSMRPGGWGRGTECRR